MEGGGSIEESMIGLDKLRDGKEKEGGDRMVEWEVRKR